MSDEIRTVFKTIPINTSSKLFIELDKLFNLNEKKKLNSIYTRMYHNNSVGDNMLQIRVKFQDLVFEKKVMGIRTSFTIYRTDNKQANVGSLIPCLILISKKDE